MPGRLFWGWQQIDDAEKLARRRAERGAPDAKVGNEIYTAVLVRNGDGLCAGARAVRVRVRAGAEWRSMGMECSSRRAVVSDAFWWLLAAHFV